MQKVYHLAITLVVLILCSLPTHQQLCSLGSPSSTSDLLQSGNTIIYNSYSNSLAKRQHSFTFTVNFAVPSSGLQVAASASSLQVGTTNGMDFSIWGSQGSTPNTGIISLLINEDNSWANIKVHYLASGRSDFFLGTFSAGVYLLAKQSQSSSLTYNYDIPKWAASQYGFSVIVEIGGLKTTSSSFAVTLSTVSFNSATGTIISTINLSSSSSIENIIITYIVLSNTSPITYSSYNINSGTTAPYQFIGADQVQNGNGVFSGYAFNLGNGVTCVGSYCPANCLTSQACQAYSGTLTSSNCYFCPPGQVYTNGACVSQVTCGQNQVYNGSVCACINGYVVINSVCFLSCGVNAYVYNSQCQCFPGYVYSSTANQCTLSTFNSCGPNFVVQSTCVCPNGFGLLNGKCVVCPANYYVLNGQCTINCPANSNWNAALQQCACVQSGQYIINGNCQACPQFSSWNGQTCVCNNGYTLSGSACIQNCPANSNWNAALQQCACVQSGQYIINGNCQVCPQFSSWTGSACVCNNGYTLSGSACIQNCPASSNWNAALQQCVCVQSGQYIINGKCQTCQQFSSWNGSTCVCYPGYNPNAGLCIQNCPANSNWNAALQQCVCVQSGQYIINGNCQGCQQFSSWNGQTCVCNNGYTLSGSACIQNCPANSNWNNALQQCACVQSGQYIINGICQACPQFSSWTGSVCVCNNGYTLSGSACIQNCPTNSYWNGQTCVCNNGYTLSGSACIQNCQSNSYWNGQACVCNNGYTLNSAGICVQNCPANSYSNGQTCVCNNGYFLSGSACVQNCQSNSYWNGQNCVCNNGYTLNSAGICVQNCPANSYSNGQTCVCNNGYFLSGSACVQNCPSNSFWNGQNCVCNSGYSLIGGNCQMCDPNSYYSTTVFTCICNNGYYGTWQQCSACSSTCATCGGPNPSQCLTCLYPNTLSNGYCVSGTSSGVCSQGFYLSNNFCYPCHVSCMTCTGPNPNSCLSCNNNYVLTGNGICVATASTTITCSSTCATCSGPNPNQCLTCLYPNALSNGFCVSSTTSVSVCSQGFYLFNNLCYPCHISCKTCSGPNPNLCLTCNNNYVLSGNNFCVAITSTTIITPIIVPTITPISITSTSTSTTTTTTTTPTSVTTTTTTTTSTITLKGYVLGYKVIYQGITLPVLPTPLPSNGCSQCNNLFTVNTVSALSPITSTQVFISNSIYWFVVSLGFAGSSNVPSFQYSIKLNSAYASYFSAADMAQVVTGSFSQSQFASSALSDLTNRQGISGPTTSGIPTSVINQIFGKPSN